MFLVVRTLLGSCLSGTLGVFVGGQIGGSRWDATHRSVPPGDFHDSGLLTRFFEASQARDAFVLKWEVACGVAAVAVTLAVSVAWDIYRRRRAAIAGAG
jgi:hypothetical protein